MRRAARRDRHAALALCAAASLAFASGCDHGDGDGLARVKKSGVLRWGGDLAGGEPYVYEDPADKKHLIGFEVDIADALARELGVRAEFQQNEWSQLIPSLDRGTFDLILNGLEVTPRTAERVALSRPYYRFAERLTVRKDDTRFDGVSVEDLARLDGKRVGTLSGSYSFELLSARPRIVPVLYDGADTPYDDLVNGRIDAVLLDDLVAEHYAVAHPELRTAADVTTAYYAAAVCRGEPSLRAAVDQALERIARSGELRRILEKQKLWSEREALLLDWTPARALELRDRSRPVEKTPAGFSLADLPLFFEGALYTLWVSLSAMALAIVLGILLALGKRYGAAPVRALCTGYVELYRGTPVLLQLYVLYYGLADTIRIGPLVAAVVGLGMNYAAYEAEVYRAGLQAVPPGQLEAALSLGMSLPQALRRILLPQALRMALPNVTNDFIALLKDSSLVSVITVVELTKRTQIAAVEGRSWLVPGLLCAGLYFAMGYPLSRLSQSLERRLGAS